VSASEIMTMSDQIPTIRTTTHSTDAIEKSFKLNIVASFAVSKRLEGVIRRILKYVEGIRHVKPTSQAILSHDL
jgi:hypothetical protein